MLTIIYSNYIQYKFYAVVLWPTKKSLHESAMQEMEPRQSATTQLPALCPDRLPVAHPQGLRRFVHPRNHSGWAETMRSQAKRANHDRKSDLS